MVSEHSLVFLLTTKYIFMYCINTMQIPPKISSTFLHIYYPQAEVFQVIKKTSMHYLVNICIDLFYKYSNLLYSKPDCFVLSWTKFFVNVV